MKKYTLIFLLLVIFSGCNSGMGTQRNYILSQIEMEDEVQLDEDQEFIPPNGN